jgi:hypothetical protein
MAITFEPLEVSMRNFISNKCNVYRIFTSGMRPPQIIVIIIITIIIMSHVVSFLENNREISNEVTRLRPVNSNRGTVFSVRAVPRCYKQENLELSWLVSE